MAEKALSPFDYVTAITQKKPSPSPSMEGYNAFVVNRALAYHSSSILAANETNFRHRLPLEMQFAYLQARVPPGRRWAKWVTIKKDPDLELLVKIYDINYEKAKRVLRLLTPNQLKVLRNLYGGLEEDGERPKRGKKSK